MSLNNLRVLGLDVSKSSVVACLITTEDSSCDPRQLYYDLDFLKLKADASGIKRLLELEPDIALLEPTGGHYSKLWVAKLAEAGVRIFLVGHKQLRVFRQGLGLADKDDDADSLALGCYYFHHGDNPFRYVRERAPVIARLRDLALRLHNVNRVKSPVFNRLKQDLKWQFPEMSDASVGAKVFWQWLAGDRQSAKYDRRYEESVGLGLQPDTKTQAKIYQQLLQREIVLELEMNQLLVQEPRFTPYTKVMKQFGFGQRIEAIILSQIFPLENFLKDGQPDVRYRKGRNSGKPTKRNLSQRRFRKALGVAPQRESSGDSNRLVKAGSKLCRTALWQWVFTKSEVKGHRPKTQVGRELGALMDLEKSRKPVKLARGKVASVAATKLFEALVKEICDLPTDE